MSKNSKSEEGAFEKDLLKHITIPSTVKHIGDNVFSCSKLVSVCSPEGRYKKYGELI